MRSVAGVLKKVSLHWENFATAVVGSAGAMTSVEPFSAVWGCGVCWPTALVPPGFGFESERDQKMKAAIATDTTTAQRKRIRRGINLMNEEQAMVRPWTPNLLPQSVG